MKSNTGRAVVQTAKKGANPVMCKVFEPPGNRAEMIHDLTSNRLLLLRKVRKSNPQPPTTTKSREHFHNL